MPAGRMTVYVTVSGEDKIGAYELDAAAGTLTPQRAEPSFAIGGGPGPLALSPSGSTLFVSRRGAGRLSSIGISSGGGLGGGGGCGGGDNGCSTVDEGGDAVFISTDRKGKYLFSCGSGAVRMHTLTGSAQGGGLADGQAPTATLETSAGAHCVVVDRSNKFVFVAHVAWDNAPLDGTPDERAAAKAGYDLSDCVRQFVLDDETGTLAPNPAGPLLHYVAMGRGPRHLAFHPGLDVAYTTDEMSSTVRAHLLRLPLMHCLFNQRSALRARSHPSTLFIWL
eukprot:SAG22_NODE_322_length_12387_cov_50.101400_8_plen_280_part_00